MQETSISDLQKRLKEFARVRDWEQFHSPKNLSMALIVEAAELVEHFQWLSQKESGELPSDKHEEVSLELADIFIYTLRLASELGVDIEKAVLRKIGINEKKYPADKVRGSHKKYTEYTEYD